VKWKSAIVRPGRQTEFSGEGHGSGCRASAVERLHSNDGLVAQPARLIYSNTH
jgi:hypothetical protein